MNEAETTVPTTRGKKIPRTLAAWVFGGWSDHHSSGIRHLSATLSRHRSLVVTILSCNLVASIFEGTSTVFLFIAARHLIGERTAPEAPASGLLNQVTGWLESVLGWEGLFIVLIALVVLTQILRSGLAFIAVSLTAKLRILARKDAYLLILRHIAGLEFARVSRHDSGKLYTHVNLAKYFDNLVETTNSVVYTIVISVSYVFVLVWVAWDVTIIAIAVLVPISLSLRKLILLNERTARQYLGAMLELNFQTLEFLNGMRLIRTFSREETSLRKLEQTIDKELDATRRGLIYQASIRPLLEVVTVAMLAGILLGGFFVFGEEARTALPDLLIFLYALYRMVPRVISLNGYWATIARILPNIAYTMDFLSEPREREPADTRRPFTGLRDAIELHNVSLRYDEANSYALEDVSFIIPVGSMVALAGESGAGKSSVIDLLIGLYEPTAGKILIDGTDLGELNLTDLRRRIGVVGQDTFILNASVRDNIAFANPDATDEEVMSAARKAHAHEFISVLERGYDTVVGERGLRLSGGQCQRLAIARALLHDPEILILDEATSELDSESERLIQEALAEFRKDRTVITIAHRLSTIAAADQIVVFDRGHVSEIGRHQELIDRNGIYARLWNIQSKAR